MTKSQILQATCWAFNKNLIDENALHNILNELDINTNNYQITKESYLFKSNDGKETWSR